jgi:hypothetical protein
MNYRKIASIVAFVAAVAVFVVAYELVVGVFSDATELSRRDIVDAVGVPMLTLGWLWGYWGYRARPRKFWLNIFLATATAALLVFVAGTISARLVSDAERALDMMSGVAAAVLLAWILILT